MTNAEKIHFSIDKTTGKETQIRSHGDAHLPIGVYYQHSRSYELGYTPWHWHEETELYFVVEGAVKVGTPSGEYILRETEGCFINSNSLHYMKPYECEDVIFQSVVFDPFIISSSISMLFDEKYLFPLLKCKQLPCIIVDTNCEYHRTIYEKISQIVFSSKKQDFGHEIMMRNLLSEIWFQLLKLAADKLQNAPKGANLDYDRIYAMLDYIHQNYTSELSSDNIAASASISVSECCRCFQRCLGQSPFDYLISYRIHKGAELLLHTDNSISDISTSVGFNSTSYFSNKFKQLLGCSPRDYRKNGIRHNV